jgi:hypothetical protein
MELSFMSVTRMSLIAAALAGSLACGVAAAQTPSGADMRAQASQAADDASKWTQKQWNAAKAKWSKEQARWDACNKKATDQKLSGRKSWSFIANCMAG